MRGLIGLCAIIIASMLIIYCTKRSETIPVLEPQGQEKPSLAAQDAKCNCAPGQASCSSDCWFSDCCICYNASSHEGGCGCWLGFASCRTKPLNTSTTSPSVSEGEKEHLVNLKDKRIREYFDFMESKGIKTRGLKQLYDGLYGQATGLSIINGEKKIKVGSIAYEKFRLSYMEFISRLDPEKQNLLQQYISSKK